MPSFFSSLSYALLGSFISLNNLFNHMLSQCLALLLFLAVMAVVCIPQLVIASLKQSFTTVRMKLYSFLSLRGIILNGTTASWGLSHLTIFISAIEIGKSQKSFKLKLNLINIQIYLSRKLASLCPVKLIDGKQQANVLYNILNYIIGAKKQDGQDDSQEKTSQKKSNAKRSIVGFFSEGVIHLFAILIVNAFEFALTDLNVFVVSGMGEEMISFQDDEARKKSLVLMQSLSEYSVKCQQIVIELQIEDEQVYKLVFRADCIYADSFNHWKSDHFVLLQHSQLQIMIPYSLSIQESVKQFQYIVHIHESIVNLIPSDFDNLFQLIKQITFNPYSKANPVNPQTNSGNLDLFVDVIKVNLRQLYDSQYDNEETKKYLMNVRDASFQLEKLSLERNKFSVQVITLLISKYVNHIHNSSLQDIEGVESQILKLKHLIISTERTESRLKICHDDVVITCCSEQIAFLGKLFIIFNERISFENYNEQIYANLQRHFVEGGTLISYMEDLLGMDSLYKDSLSEEIRTKQQKLVYQPQKLTFFLKMKKLSHKITFDEFKYTRYSKCDQINHKLTGSKVTIEYQGIKEFAIGDIELIFSLTTRQNQLSLSIGDIMMNQNQQTLIDYLDSYTLFKHLLQFESDEEEKTLKLYKKYISIKAITLNFCTEVLVINELSISKETNVNKLMNNFYFTLGKCQIVLNKIKNENSKLRYPLQKSQVLFSLESLTISKSFVKRHIDIKSKGVIVVKRPAFKLPEVDITSRIHYYIQLYAKIRSHIEAFLIDVTNQKLQSIKYLIKGLLIEPEHLAITIFQMNLCIVDTKFDQALLSFNRIIRQYFSQFPKYNEAEIISFLKRSSGKIDHLLCIDINKIVVEIQPITELQQNNASISEWIQTFQTPNTNLVKSGGQEKFFRVKAEKVRLRLDHLTVRIRDYPSSILQIKDIMIKTERMRAKRLSGILSSYLKAEVNISSMVCCIGLGQLSGWQQIQKRLNHFQYIKNLSKTSNKSTQQNPGALTVLHRVFDQWTWRINVKKQSQTKIIILTQDHPYGESKIELRLATIQVCSTNQQTTFINEKVALDLECFNIVTLPRLVTTLQISKLNKKDFMVRLDAKIGEEAVKLRISSEIIRYLQRIGQYKRDWLLIYRIYDAEVRVAAKDEDNLQFMNYLQILDLMATQKINSSERDSIIQYISSVKTSVSIARIEMSLMERNVELKLQASDLEIFNIIQPSYKLYNQFKVQRSRISARLLTLKVIKKVYREKKVQLIKEKQQFVSKVEQIDFWRCQKMRVHFNWYFVSSNNKINFANQWISIDCLYFYFDKQVHRYLLAIIRQFRVRESKEVTENKHSLQLAKSRFNEIIYKIIKINRRNKMLKQKIIKFKSVVRVNSYTFRLRNEDKQMVWKCQKPSMFFFKNQYREDDKYHLHKIKHFSFDISTNVVCVASESGLPQRLAEFNTISVQIVTASNDKMVESEQLNWGRCEIKYLEIILTKENKDILGQIVDFVIKLQMTNEERQLLYQTQSEKYYEFKSFKKKDLKEKIEWKQNNLKNKQAKAFKWHFSFSRLNFYLQHNHQKLLTISVNSIEMIVRLFQNSKVIKNIAFRQIEIVNEMEEENSQYRKILEIVKDAVALEVAIETYEVNAFSSVEWRYYKELSFKILPLRIKLTQRLKGLLDEFFERENEDQQPEEYDDITEYISKTPSYYKSISLAPIKVDISYRSQSIFTKMENIKFELDKYQLKEKLYTKKQLERQFTIWFLKQFFARFFSILGQKLFGDDQKFV